MTPLHNAKRFFYKACKQPGYAFKVFNKRLGGYLCYWLRDGRTKYPEAITLFLTYRCNLRCKMCGQWGESGVTKKQSSQRVKEELSLEELKKIINDVVTFMPNITLFGGEPLLHHACVEIIQYIKKKGVHCLMITNGSMLENLAERVVESGLDELNISLDGNAELHDQIRGMSGLFGKIMGGVKQINYFKAIKNRKKPLINLQCTINKQNYQHLEQMIDVANEAEADSLTFHNLIFLERDVLNKQKEYDNLLGCKSSDWEGFVFEPGIKSDVLYAKMKDVLAKRHRFPIDFYPNFSLKGLKGYYQNPSYLPKVLGRCISPWMVAYVFPDGEVRPCLNFDYSYGNVIENKFTDLWNNASAIRFRKILKKNRIFPVCIRCTELYRY